MRSRLLAILIIFALLGVLGITIVNAQGGTPVFINEIHYDNASTDVGEAIEVAGPSGTDLTGWSIALYNGSATQLNVYDTIDLSGVIPDQDGGFGTLSFSRAGIQNGSPDGLALIDSSSTVVQFLSYEGSFTAGSGPAAGLTSIDIGVSEGSSTLIGDSLQLIGSGSEYEDFTWTGPSANSFGAVNNGQTFGTTVAPPFVNELHYDNTGADADEGIEIAGLAGIDLSGWSIVLYNGNGGAPYNTIVLGGTIPDLQAGYGALWFAQAGIQNGSPDGFALVDPSDNVLQFLSYEGTFAAVGGPADGMTSTDIGVSEGSSTPVGHSLQLAGTGTVYDDFSWMAPASATYGAVNTGQSFGEVVNEPIIATCGGTLYVNQTYEATREITASDADGTVVDMAITNITPFTDAITIGETTPAAEIGGEASAIVTIGSGVEAGSFIVEVTATNDDVEPQTGSCTFNVVVNPFLTIGEVQGVVNDTDNGLYHRSPYAPPSGNDYGDYVLVQGVIYQKTVARASWGGSYNGFFMQNTPESDDDNPLTSDGIFVFMSTYNDLIGGYVPQVGDEVVLLARVTEYYYLTQLVSARGIEVIRTGVVLDNEVPAFETEPPDDLDDANRYWERHEGMRAQIPAGSIVLNGRDVFASSLDSEVWVMRGDHELAQRTDPYARRSFRDAHPLDNNPGELFDDGNGYRIIMGGLGVKGASGDNTTLLAPARTYDTLNNEPMGGVYFSYSKYQIQVEQQPDLTPGVDPALNNPPQAFERDLEYSVVTFNVENLYDYVDDAFDGCDFVGNDGCPGVYPPFDYVPASDEVYQNRLTEIAQQIINDLHSPDIILAQEAEDQDVCYVDGGTYTCPAFDDQVNNADGKPDTLQELALKIYDLGGPMYDATLDRDGADDRGIISGYLFRTDRVELLPAHMDDPVLGDSPMIVYEKPGAEPLPYNFDVQNPKVLNATLPNDVTGSTDGDNVFTRPPQVGLFRMWRDGVGTSVFTDMYISDNHFSSGPDNRVDQRTEQASYNAAIVAALQEADSEVYVTVGGDLNVYPRPDDPFPPPDESDQLAGLYNQSMQNLWNVLLAESPVSTYGYIYQGQSQTLDQMFVTPSWMTEFVQVNSAHINSDFPADYPGDGPRGTSDHDPLVARYSLLPTLDRLEGLLYYFDSMGEIYGNKTLKIMLDRLDRARKFESKGQMDAYADQLYAFASQAQDFAPDQMSQLAADALAQEALLLVSLP